MNILIFFIILIAVYVGCVYGKTLLQKLTGGKGIGGIKSIPSIRTMPLPEGETASAEEGRSILGAHLKRAVKNKNWKRYVFFSVLAAVVLFLPALKAEIVGNYSLLLIPTFLVNIVMIFYACSQKANVYCVYGFLLLNTCAALSRAAFGNADNVGAEIYIFMTVGLVLSFILAVGQRWMSKLAHWQWVLAAVATIGILFCCRFTKDVHGASNWWDAGLFNIQLTEVAKFGYVFFIGLLFFSTYSVWEKFWVSFVVTGICCALLVIVCNELGTVIVICLAYYVTAILTLKDFSATNKRKKSARKAKIVLTVFAVLMVAIVWAGYSYVDSNMGIWHCPNEACETDNASDLEQCSECNTEKPSLGAEFKCPYCSYTTWEEVQLVTDEDGEINLRLSCPNCPNDFLLGGKQRGTIKKLYERFAITYNYESVKDSGIVYQMEQCHSAMKVGGLFGDMDTIVTVPVHTVDTDSVVATLTNRLGLLFVLVILAGFCLVFLSVWDAYSPLRIMAICTFVFQAIITYLGTMNMIPATGIGVPLISRGGSNLVICYLLMYLMLTSVKKYDRGGKKNNENK